MLYNSLKYSGTLYLMESILIIFLFFVIYCYYVPIHFQQVHKIRTRPYLLNYLIKYDITYVKAKLFFCFCHNCKLIFYYTFIRENEDLTFINIYNVNNRCTYLYDFMFKLNTYIKNIYFVITIL